MKDNKEIIHTGLGFGGALAITMSWGFNHSVFWAIIHGICNWFYVLWYLILG